MATKNPRRLVIDADVAHIAGGELSIYPEGKDCGNFLVTVLKAGHSVVISQDIKTEWDKHASDFSLRWLTSMERKGRVVEPDNATSNQELFDKIRDITLDFEVSGTILISKIANSESEKELLNKIKQETMSFKVKEVINRYLAMQKDFRLIDAALKTDKTVISKDEIARKHFTNTASTVLKLKQIVWVNPVKSEEAPIKWLNAGAKAERERKLGYQSQP